MAKWKSGARGGRPDRGGGGSGGGRGRGNNGRGRAGAGWAVQGPGRGRGHSHSGSNGSNQDQLDIDFTLQTFADAPSPLKPSVEPSAGARGKGFPAYRGRGRGGPLIPSRLSAETTFPGRGRGFDIPRRQVQGIGAPRDARRPVPVGAKQTLSSLLLQERPLLKPIVFVPSTETRFLFQNEEDLLQPIVEDVGDTIQSPIPTADRVTRVFSGGNIPPNVWNNDEDDTEDEIEVVDFNDFGKLFLPTTTNSNTAIWKRKAKAVSVENATVHEGLITRNATQETLPAEIENRTDKLLSGQNGTGLNGNHLFYVDTQPGNVPNGMEFPTIQQHSSSFLRDDDDDIIVYDAPHPRNKDTELTEDVAEFLTTNDHGWVAVDKPGFASRERPPALLTSVSHTQPKSTLSIVDEEPVSSMSPTTIMRLHIPEPPFSPITLAESTIPNTAETSNAATETGATTISTRLRVPPITTLRQAKLWMSKVSRANKGSGSYKPPRESPFSAFGTMREEDLLRVLDGERDERYNERRRGDSDIEWGDTTEDGGGDVVGVGKEAVAQEPEPDLDADMKRVLGMLKKGKGRTGENLKQAGDDIDNDHGMEVDVDVDIATLEQFVKGLTGADAEKHVTMDDVECEQIIRIEDESEKDVEQRGSSSNEDDENEETEEEEGVDDDDDDYEDSSFRLELDRLRSRSIANRGFDDGDELNMSWADRDETFIQDIDDMLEILPTNGRKHKQKLYTSLGGDREYSNWPSSPPGRRGDKDKGIPPELSIQYEIDRQKKAELKRVRELERLTRAADTLSNKKGWKKGRKAMLAAAAVDPTIIVIPNRVIDMTTLVQKIRRFIADLGGPSSMPLPPTDKETRKNVHEIAASFNLKSVSKGKGDARYITLVKTTKTNMQVNEGKIAMLLRRSGAKGVLKVPKQREGDVVGEAAPKLDESNVGFRLLEMMGWSEGDRIGASTNGLEVPLAAIIKTSKLGLGAKK